MISIFELLDKLRAAQIFFRLSQIRDDSIMIESSVPGERWEIEYMRDGSIEIEIFISNGIIHDASTLESFIQRFSERE